MGLEWGAEAKGENLHLVVTTAQLVGRVKAAPPEVDSVTSARYR